MTRKKISGKPVAVRPKTTYNLLVLHKQERTMPSPDGLSEKELKQVLERAQEMQNEAKTSPQEARQIGAELGIDPKFTNAALAEKQQRRLNAPPPSSALPWVLIFFALLLLGAGSYWYFYIHAHNETNLTVIEVTPPPLTENTNINIQKSSTSININTSHTEIHTSHKETHTNSTLTPTQEQLEKAFVRQLALVEESRGIIGKEAAAIDALIQDFQTKTDLADKISVMKRINDALREAVFFKSPIGDALATSILSENTQLHSIFFFAKPI